MNSVQPAAITDDDVRAIVRLLGEVASLTGGHGIRKRCLMDGLCALIGADNWVWTLGCQYEKNKPPVYVNISHGGFTEEQFPKFLAAVDHPVTGAMTIPMIDEIRDRQIHLTLTAEEIAGGKFYDYEASGLWQKANIGTVMLSSRALDERSASCIGFYRCLGKTPFTPRESRLAHIVLTEVPWLHEQGWPEDRGVSVPHLSPRQRLVLNLLMECRSRKEIACDLAISPNTISGYVKEIFRHFGVHSHAELMRRFR